jgi:iron uptake system EfeUOB component EfeO/EfeM
MSRRTATVALGAAGLLVVAGAGAVWFAAGAATPGPADADVAMTVTDTACEPAELSLSAGRTTFRIHNASTRPLEWEILDGAAVIAERENIAPGLDATVSSQLQPGSYQMTCGLPSNPRGTLTATSASSDGYLPDDRPTREGSPAVNARLWPSAAD